jgi:diphthine-ammonia ligase
LWDIDAAEARGFFLAVLNGNRFFPLDELDSYMYQTVGHDVIHLYKDCLEVPLYRQEIRGVPIEQGSDYVETAMDETEDLYELLKKVKAAHPDLQAVSVGAILSNYQRIRVESM